ncbi:MAG: KUP/HAK/KT family potassium transporter [Candidatus Tectimicrobiota bacterium]
MQSVDAGGNVPSTPQAAHRLAWGSGGLALLVVQACGVVYGDIGTSILYTLREIFFGAHTYGHVPLTQATILGAVSLIFWALLLLITTKYIAFVLYADYNGEGGVFALLGQLEKQKYRGAGIVTGMLLLAAGLLYGDGLITPAISILSAVEGLEYMTADFQPYVMWIAAGIVLGLFAVQRTGTARVGMWFGWFILVWLLSSGLWGAVLIWRQPQILLAVNPAYGLAFLAQLDWRTSLVVLGFVMLAVTGGEAMYADLGHFGRLPIQVGWLALVYPCLVLNYGGQGAFLLGHLQGEGILPPMVHIFYAAFHAVVPGTGALILMVSLATLATIIASQALISGAYSLTAQAIALGYGGRMEITHTSTAHAGQIYMRLLTWLLCGGCLVLIFLFQSSSKLASAYGLAVSGVMLSTSLAMIPLAILRWRWPVLRASLLFGLFAMLEGTFLLANSMKFLEGGFVPLLIGIGLFVAMSNYHWGRTHLLGAAYSAYATTRDMRWFLALKQRLIANGGVLHELTRDLKEAERTDVFMTSRPVVRETDGVPVVLRAYLKRHGTVAKNLLLLTIDQQRIPVVEPEQQYTVTVLGANVWVIIASFGYMQKPDVPLILHETNAHPALQHLDLSLANIEIGEEEILVDPTLSWWRKFWVRVFALQLKIATPAHRYFGLKWDHPMLQGLAGIEHLSKTIVPVFVHATGASILLPDRDKRL